jgi:hypothetical protein
MYQWLESKLAAESDGGAGVINVDGVECYVQGEPSQKMLDIAFRWAVNEQGYAGQRADWDAMPLKRRIEYERGACGLPTV